MLELLKIVVMPLPSSSLTLKHSKLYLGVKFVLLTTQPYLLVLILTHQMGRLLSRHQSSHLPATMIILVLLTNGMKPTSYVLSNPMRNLLLSPWIN